MALPRKGPLFQPPAPYSPGFRSRPGGHAALPSPIGIDEVNVPDTGATRSGWALNIPLLLLCACLHGCDGSPQARLEPGESHPGGATTTAQQDANAFSMPSNNLRPIRRMDFFVGNAFFRSGWKPAGNGAQGKSGLGPLFNTDACQSCHIKDGRGHPPHEQSLAPALSALVRLSIPASEEDAASLVRNGVIAEPVYGGQLQDNALEGHRPEGRVWLEYTRSSVTLADGTDVHLRQPKIEIRDLGYGPLHPDTLMSLRVAPPMIGLGLLEAIPDAELEANARDQASQGQVSGRLNRVWDEASARTVIGRFGWKAGQPSLRQQNAAAFAGDMGLSSSVFAHDDCTGAQSACREAPQGSQPEVSESVLDSVLFYTRHLAVPMRREAGSPDVLRGKAVFSELGCAACHRPSYTTGEAAEAELAQQHIYPYTDLLLHDMGPGLADGRPEFLASGSEWRTPPLWGIGLTATVSGHTQYLHDGRAESLLEAILWHGGEAQGSRDRVVALATDDRLALLRFLESL